MVVPLIARGRALGALTFISAESGRRYDRTDLQLAEELGRRARERVLEEHTYEHRARRLLELIGLAPRPVEVGAASV
jgi:GAF domain-containing protein